MAEASTTSLIDALDAGTLPAAWSSIRNMTTMTLMGNSLRGVRATCRHHGREVGNSEVRKV